MLLLLLLLLMFRHQVDENAIVSTKTDVFGWDAKASGWSSDDKDAADSGWSWSKND